MRKHLLTILMLMMIGFNVNSAWAATVELFEYKLTPSSSFNTAGFDFGTGLGSMTVVVSNQGSNYVGAFFDHEIYQVANTFFNEYGRTNGIPASGQTWQIDEPGWGNPQTGYVGTIYDNLVNGSLDGKVFQGTMDGPEDAAMAMAWAFKLLAGETATITFLVGTSVPSSGFYLEQYDLDSNSSIYLSSTFDKTAVPLPAAVWLFGSGLVGLVGWRWRRKG
jgi:hypothetical protein